MIEDKPRLEQSTYQRNGVWYTLHVADRTNAFERLATPGEIPVVEDQVEVKKVKKAKQ